jgi:hypothetical protein
MKISLPSNSPTKVQPQNKEERRAAPEQQRLPTQAGTEDAIKNGHGHGPRLHADWKK